MKVVIFAGGYGTRISEESVLKPKPMIEIGGKPIIWHIMKIYEAHGLTDFIILCGYKGYLIKEYFSNYFLHNSDVTVDLIKNSVEIHQHTNEPWRVTLVDTGESTMTGGRLKRAKDYIGQENFCLTYGDGLSNVDIKNLIAFHDSHQCLATVTAVQPTGRFGRLEIGGDNNVKSFVEKPIGEDGWINGGFFVLSPRVFDLIENDQTIWEREPLEKLADNNELKAWRHDGFWQPMDTLRDKVHLESLWNSSACPWKVW